MRRLHLDFESRSRINIWDSGAARYAEDASTEVMCLAYAIDNGPVEVIRRSDILAWPLVDPFEELTALANDPEVLFYAHNAFFEQVIWLNKMVPFGLPPIPIKRWRCTAAKALSHGLPKALKDVALALGLAERKDMGGRAVMLKVCKPTVVTLKDKEKYKKKQIDTIELKHIGKGWGAPKWGEVAEYWEEGAELLHELEEYCRQDVEVERAIDKKLPELSKMEQTVWFEDQLINHRGIAVDTEAVTRVLDVIEDETTNLKQEIFRLTDGELDGVSRRLAVLAYFKKRKVVLKDFTKATVTEAIQSGKLDKDLVNILKIRQQLGLSSTAKYKKFRDATSRNGRLKDILVYHSAGTGRWGGKLVQLQNLPKGTIKDTDTACEMIKTEDVGTLKMLYGNIMALLSSCIRGMLVSAPGRDLIVADYAAIEARVIMWLAGQEDAVKMFAEGTDIYVEMAKRIGGKASRQLGKQAVLGCGFGMGADRFKGTCATYGIQVTEELALKAVQTYRKTFFRVPAYWREQEQAMKTAISTKKKVTTSTTTWEYIGDFLYVTLPSGRRLAYHKARIQGGEIKYMTTNSTTKKYGWESTYGGKIVENITQATARDIMAHGMIKAEIAGYELVLTVHDEIVAEVAEGEKSLDEFVDIITSVPSWAAGCPVSAEGWRGKRYKKG